MPHSPYPISCHIHHIQSHATLTVSNLKEIRTGSCRHAVENGVPIDVIGVDVIDEVPRALGVCWLQVHCDCNGEGTLSDVFSLRTGAWVSLLWLAVVAGSAVFVTGDFVWLLMVCGC